METQALKVTDNRLTAAEPTSNLPVSAEPNAIIMMAMQKGYTPELIEKMMALQERYEEKESKKAYYEAKSAFKSGLPPVIRDKKNTQYDSMYASEAALMNTLNPYLSKQGLEVSFKFPPCEKGMAVTCVLSHKLGHSEEVTLPGPLDTSGSKNPLQQVKSTVTYLRKATFEAITGIATSDPSDDDGNGAGDGKMKAFEQWEIKATEVCEAAQSLEDIIKWWPDNSDAIKKELSPAESAKIYEMVVARKKELKTAERVPGAEG